MIVPLIKRGGIVYSRAKSDYKVKEIIHKNSDE